MGSRRRDRGARASRPPGCCRRWRRRPRSRCARRSADCSVFVARRRSRARRRHGARPSSTACRRRAKSAGQRRRQAGSPGARPSGTARRAGRAPRHGLTERRERATDGTRPPSPVRTSTPAFAFPSVSGADRFESGPGSGGVAGSAIPGHVSNSSADEHANASTSASRRYASITRATTCSRSGNIGRLRNSTRSSSGPPTSCSSSGPPSARYSSTKPSISSSIERAASAVTSNDLVMSSTVRARSPRNRRNRPSISKCGSCGGVASHACSASSPAGVIVYRFRERPPDGSVSVTAHPRSTRRFCSR